MYKSSWLTLFSKSRFMFGDRPIDQYIIFECKYLFSIIVFNFIKSDRSQDRMHTHAFKSISIKLRGSYDELIYDERDNIVARPRKRIIQYFERNKWHAIGPSKSNCWTILFAGPWRPTWLERDMVTEHMTCYSWNRHKIMTNTFDRTGPR